MYDSLTGTGTGELISSYVQALTREEELDLFKQYDKTKDNNVLLKIVTTYSPIIRSLVNQFCGYRIDSEELAAEGLLALTEAAKRFDHTLGFRFATFAKKWVKGFMFVHITKNFIPASISKERDAKMLFFRLKQFITQISDRDSEFKLTSTISSKLAEMYDVSVFEIERMYSLLIRPADYFSDVLGNNDAGDFTIEDTLAASSDTQEAIQRTETHEFQKRIIRDAMGSVLDEREAVVYYAQVICERHDEGFRTLDDLAGDFKVSKERIRQVRIRAERLMKEELTRRVAREGWGMEDLYT